MFLLTLKWSFENQGQMSVDALKVNSNITVKQPIHLLLEAVKKLLISGISSTMCNSSWGFFSGLSFGMRCVL